MSKYNVDNGLLMDRRDRMAAKQSKLRFLYNPDEKTVLGRTAKSWGKLFYLIYLCECACARARACVM